MYGRAAYLLKAQQGEPSSADPDVVVVSDVRQLDRPVRRGRVAQAPLAQELKKLFASDGFAGVRRSDDFHEEARKFFVNYFKQIALVFEGAWNGRKYAIKSATAGSIPSI